MVDKRQIALIAVVLILVVVFRANRRQNVDDVGVGFSESDLDSLGEALDDQSFDDLGGLGNEIVVGLSEFDLDALGDALEQLSFEDLEGITEN